jgi:hypothetical protein
MSFPSLEAFDAGQSVLEQLRFACIGKHERRFASSSGFAHAAGLAERGIQTKRARGFNSSISRNAKLQASCFELLDDLTAGSKGEKWLKKSAGRRQSQLALTHKGIGLLSALALFILSATSRAFLRVKKRSLTQGLDSARAIKCRKFVMVRSA